MANTLKLTPHVLRELSRMKGEGRTVIQMSDRLGIARNTVYQGLSKLELEGLKPDPNHLLCRPWVRPIEEIEHA